MKKVFYLVFGILNFLLTPIIPISLVSFIVIFIAINNHSNNGFILRDYLLIFFLSIFLLLYYILRLFIFPLIYTFYNNPYISKFFERISKEKAFKNKVLLLSFLADMAIILTFLSEVFFTDIRNFLSGFILYSLIGGGGVTLSYLSLIVWFKITNSLNKS